LLLSAEALSYRDVIAQIEDVTGKSIEVETLEPGQRIELVPAQMRDILTELMTGLALGPEMNFTTPEVAEMFGISSQPSRTFRGKRSLGRRLFSRYLHVGSRHVLVLCRCGPNHRGPWFCSLGTGRLSSGV
jgi:hypothetical protein